MKKFLFALAACCVSRSAKMPEAREVRNLCRKGLAEASLSLRK